LTSSDRQSRWWYDSHFWDNQGATPHCVGFAWMHWLTNSPIVNWIDPHGIYRIAQQFDEWKGTAYDGTSVRAGAKVLNWLGLIKEYQWCWDLQTLISTVLEKGPVVVGTEWLGGMEKPDSHGIIQAIGASLGGHAYLITGVSVPRGLFRIKNSWGRGWGKGGRAYISFEGMEKLIGMDGEVCLAVEGRATPPRSV